MVLLDEPVLSEVVFTGAKNARSFTCGALSEKGDAARELDFARELVNAAVRGIPRSRLGNWTRDEQAALSGDYAPLLPTLRSLDVGTFFLDLCTPRAGDLDVLRSLPDDRRVGIGVVNQKRDEVEPVGDIVARVRRAIDVFGRDRILLTPDCGFATFADNPVTAPGLAEEKLRAIVRAAEILRGG